MPPMQVERPAPSDTRKAKRYKYYSSASCFEVFLACIFR